MNRLQNSIVRFLKYVIESENYFIKYQVPILPQSILQSRQFPSIDFCYAGEGVEAVYNRKPLNRDCISSQKWMKFRIVIIIIITIIIILYQYT